MFERNHYEITVQRNSLPIFHFISVNSTRVGLWSNAVIYLWSVLTVATTSGVDLSPFQLEVLKQAHVVYLTRAARKGHNSWKKMSYRLSVLFVLSELTYKLTILIIWIIYLQSSPVCKEGYRNQYCIYKFIFHMLDEKINFDCSFQN